MSEEEKPSVSKIAVQQSLRLYFTPANPVGVSTESELDSRPSQISSESEVACGELVGSQRSKSGGQNYKNLDDENENGVFCLGLSKRQWQSFIVILTVGFFAGVVFSIKGPFYPHEAERKGASATQYGLVFGMFELTKAIASPIFGHYMKSLGPRNVFYFGISTVAVCSILFGLLHEVNNVTAFVTYSFIIRIVEAFGNSAFSTAAFTTVISEFPSSVATAFASYETTFGIGLIVGPMMGGLFFELGGYPTPFIVTGVLLFITFVVTLFIMPLPLNTDNNDAGNTVNKYADIFVILSSPGVLLSAVAVLSSGSSVGYVATNLEPHIRQFDLTPVQLGAIFIIFGIFYASFAPVWGRICDKLKKPAYILCLGSALITIAVLLIGPAPFLNFNITLWVTSVGLMLHGLGVSAVFVSGFIVALQYAIRHGFPDDVSTYSVISGLFASISSLGMFIGPSAGGILIDKVGFRWGLLMILVPSALLAVLILIFIFVETRILKNEGYATKNEEYAHTKSNSENESLLITTANQLDEKLLSKSQNYGSLE